MVVHLGPSDLGRLLEFKFWLHNELRCVRLSRANASRTSTPMALSHQLESFFSAAVRQRGREYAGRRAVIIGRGDAWSVRAFVLGSKKYQVDLKRIGQDITACCTCPFVEREEPCKHIWAAILTTTAQNLMRGDGRSRASSLSLDQDELDRRAGIDDSLDKDNGSQFSGFGRIGTGTRRSRWSAAQRRAVAERMKRYWAARRRKAPPPTSHSPEGINVQRAARPSRARSSPPVIPEWRRRLAHLPVAQAAPLVEVIPSINSREIVYILDVSPVAPNSSAFVLEIGWRDRKANGDWGRVQTKSYLGPELLGAATSADIRVLDVCCGVEDLSSYENGHARLAPFIPNRVHLRRPLREMALPELCATGRCLLRRNRNDMMLAPLSWDDGLPWELWLELNLDEQRGVCVLEGAVRREDEYLTLREPVLFFQDGHLVTSTHVARFDHRGGFGWIPLLTAGPLVVPRPDVDALLAEIVARPGSPRLSMPDGLGVPIVRGAPRKRLTVRSAPANHRSQNGLYAETTFEYEGADVGWGHPADRLIVANPCRIIERDRAVEQSSVEQLAEAGFRQSPGPDHGRPYWTLPARQLPSAVRTLLSQGWTVEADGRRYRTATGTRANIRSGVDWFDLEGTVDFGDVSASIGAVTTAVAHGDSFVTLDDGSEGLVPEEWLARQGHWAALAERHGDGLRFSRGQVGLLEALLAAVPTIDVDEQFKHAIRELRAFEGIVPADPTFAFCGRLRTYQRDGLGWIHFLERFRFGGCLADDMGLGKTIQVLAALAGRRASGLATLPSLVVVPRSLVFNWLREAKRFAPELRLLDHTGQDRTRDLTALGATDVVVTTYGTLRRDVAHLAHVDFDYIVLDEAHAIKNIDAQTTKAVRLLRGAHRLALTGTPVQNHLGELWSLFEFLNPGILGRSGPFVRALTAAAGDPAARETLVRLLRPFILRRTKAEAAPELPVRIEDTIVCRLGPEERAFYDRLKEYYQQSLGARIARDGWARSAIHVLEALLRLRQAACHPGLVDAAKKGATSAKLEVLLSHLREVGDEGHKAIVFSQFVRLLDIVRTLLERDGVAYAYLDGRTRNRAAAVERFQTDPDCKLFLVSLKAGGLGLNLTAAEYVFLLDPWWNPAIEAQAVDRAHRLGQTRRVFAYRLIAENTIEEKVLALQAQKRELVDAILGEGAPALRQLTPEDLELLLE